MMDHNNNNNNNNNNNESNTQPTEVENLREETGISHPPSRYSSHFSGRFSWYFQGTFADFKIGGLNPCRQKRQKESY
jgi:hypothetical protein